VVIPDGSYPDSTFISDCKSNNVTCGANNSNDGTSSAWSLAYYQQMAASGVQWVIGESESGSEMYAMMTASPTLIGGTYGGEGTGGPMGNNDIWSGNEFTPSGGAIKGKVNAWLECYTSSAMISADEIATEAALNKDAGVFEVGLLPGTWCEADYGATAETYLEMIDAMASQGVTCAGLQMWYYQGGFSFPDIFTGVMAEYPANMTPILQRAGGVTPPPPPASIVAATAPAICSIDGTTQDIFVVGSDKQMYWSHYQ